MIKETKKIVIGSFFLNHFCGLGIMFDFEPVYLGTERLFTFEVKLFYYKLWIIVHKNECK